MHVYYGLSIDSKESHFAWINNIFHMTGVKVPFPIVADRSGEISRKYGMIATNESAIATVRNVFIIDCDGVIRCILIYPIAIRKKCE